MTLLDFDTVALSNLQRQTLHSDATIGEPKVESAKAPWRASIRMFSSTPLTPCWMKAPCQRRLPPTIWCWIARIMSPFATSSTPGVLRIVFRWSPVPPFVWRGKSVSLPGDGEPCYRCLSRLFGENALTCVEAGVMAPLVGVMGSLQALEAIKVLTRYGVPATGKS
jgi:adenylyltransferase/sulfurtransferase